MSGKLLDETGLAEVWRKVQQRSIPVKALSQNDYDSLDESEKQKDILYICTPASGGQATLYYKEKKLFDSGSTTVDGDTYLVKAPVGTIVIWGGTADTIPTGWHLCDGEDGTPDLRDKFVLGAEGSHSVDETGGEEKVSLTISQIPSHNHAINLKGSGNATAGNFADTFLKEAVYENGKLNTTSTGSGSPHNNMPPYYALCYIMKITADETDGGVDFTINDTLTMQDNVLGVTLPTKGIITQTDFDALSLEEQKRGVYFIPGTGPGSSDNSNPSQNIYSTEETVIGRWIDGKLIYRTVGVTNTPSTITDTSIIKPISGLDTILRLDVLLKYDDIIHKFPIMTHPDFLRIAYAYYSISKGLMISIKSENFLQRQMLYIMEYTKTTDEVIS